MVFHFSYSHSFLFLVQIQRPVSRRLPPKVQSTASGTGTFSCPAKPRGSRTHQTVSSQITWRNQPALKIQKSHQENESARPSTWQTSQKRQGCVATKEINMGGYELERQTFYQIPLVVISSVRVKGTRR